MHADTVDGVLEQLIHECDVPQHLIGQAAFVVPVFVGHRNGSRVRRVSEIAVLEPLAKAYDQHSIARWDAEADEFEILSTPAAINAASRRLGFEDEGEFLDALEVRERFLEELIRGNVTSMDDVQLRVLKFMGYEVVEDDGEADDDD
jgi:hypothetical protein